MGAIDILAPVDLAMNSLYCSARIDMLGAGLHSDVDEHMLMY